MKPSLFRRTSLLVRFAMLSLLATVLLVKPSLLLAGTGDGTGEGDNVCCVERILDWFNPGDGGDPPAEP
ncbi:MAG: hypothetical protein L6Q92_09760 [Phycisphaerae bacterium]|nr:hypothetical protein [Phycisphaerae bacterium]